MCCPSMWEHSEARVILALEHPVLDIGVMKTEKSLKDPMTGQSPEQTLSLEVTERRGEG